ncbi:MAG: peroxide stress protein YaaA [Akkermansiaceae bacterium]
MLYLLSPAKTLDYDSEVPSLRATMPRFLDDSAELAGVMQKMKPAQLEKLMSISSKLAELNAERFDDWRADYSKPEGRQSILAFKGDVYQGLAVEDWQKEDFSEAQKSIRILSGLYGILRPLDLMLPYRLEMGTKLTTERGKNLYQFWSDSLTNSLNKELKAKGDAVINLASNEYFSAVQPKDLKAPIITPVFKDWKNGKYKIISFYAKKARGMMAGWAVQKKISRPSDLKRFKGGGYKFDKSLSDDTSWVFTRKA